MHRSRLAAVIIDCDNLEAGVQFWTGALGSPEQGRLELGNIYVKLKSPAPNLMIWLQGVPDKKTAKSRVHLDFESDDIDAEVRRLEALGATRQTKHDGWWTMHDPCGNEFCVLPPYSDVFEQESKTWD